MGFRRVVFEKVDFALSRRTQTLSSFVEKLIYWLISLEGKMSNENLHLSANKSSFVIMFLNLNFNLTYEDVH